MFLFVLEIFKRPYYQYLLENKAFLKMSFHITTFTREINTNEAVEWVRVISLIYWRTEKLQLLRSFVKFRGNISQDASVPG